MAIDTLFKLPEFSDQEKERASKLVFNLICFTWVAFILLGVSTFLLQPTNLARALNPLLIISMMSLLNIGLLHLKKLILANTFFVFQLWLVVTSAAISGGGMETPAVQGYILVVLAAGLLIGWRWGLLTGLVCVVTQILITYAQLNNTLQPYQGLRTPLTYLIVYTLISILAVLFVYYYASNIRASLNSSKLEVIKRNQVEHVLRERVKELITLQNVSKILESEDKSLEAALREIVTVLPLGWQYIDITKARIVFDGQDYSSPAFVSTQWVQKASFYTRDNKVGVLEIAYLEERPTEVEGPFLAEERRLINTLAEMLQTYLRRREAEQNNQRHVEHITALLQELENRNIELTIAYDVTLEGWSKALDLRDKETEGHSLRVTEMTLRLASTIGLPDDQLVYIRKGALLHDVGKLGIPDNVLLKPGKLTDEEWDIMKKHPLYAYEWLSPIVYLQSALDISYCHHEKWDGSGYPQGLSGEQIPLAARLFAIVDVYDALTSDRPYRSAWTKNQTLEYIQDQSGKYFDPQLVEVFLQLMSKVD